MSDNRRFGSPVSITSRRMRAFGEVGVSATLKHPGVAETISSSLLSPRNATPWQPSCDSNGWSTFQKAPRQQLFSCNHHHQLI